MKGFMITATIAIVILFINTSMNSAKIENLEQSKINLTLEIGELNNKIDTIFKAQMLTSDILEAQKVVNHCNKMFVDNITDLFNGINQAKTNRIKKGVE